MCFCRGLRRPCTRRRVRPGAMRRWRESVSGWERQAVFRRNVRFVLPLFCGMTKQIFRRTSPHCERASSLVICCHIGITRCKNIQRAFAKAIAKQKAVKRPVNCYRNSLYPNPLNFLFSKIISLSPLKGNIAKI